jgi:hypothetical protein
MASETGKIALSLVGFQQETPSLSSNTRVFFSFHPVTQQSHKKLSSRLPPFFPAAVLMQFIQPVNVRHHGGIAADDDGWATRGSMFLPGMTTAGPELGGGRINYTIRRRRTAVEDVLLPVGDDRNDDNVQRYPSKSAQKEIEKKKLSLQEDNIHVSSRKESTSRPIISYQAVPGGPWRTFKSAKTTSRKNQAAATTIQRLVRGHCVRTKLYIQRLERKLARIRRRTRAELQAIEESKKQMMLQMRQQMIQQETRTFKTHMACAETASHGVRVIQHLRHENKNLRNKNDKIARAIAELRHQNERLEKAATMTVSNESLLTNHYNDHIQSTHRALEIVVPQYQKKLKAMTEAVDIRHQYWTTERKMKILYGQLVGALVEMVEDQCDDQDLVDSVVAMCVELKEALPKAAAEEEEESKQQDEEEMVLQESNDEYYEDDDESDDEESDSNDYDEYDIADYNQ